MTFLGLYWPSFPNLNGNMYSIKIFRFLKSVAKGDSFEGPTWIVTQHSQEVALRDDPSNANAGDFLLQINSYS